MLLALPPGRGRGIAVAIKSGATTGLSNSTVRLLADGSVIVYAGTSDMGQGARTIFAQLAADALGAPLDKVQVVMGDTSVVPFDLQTSASHSTVFMGTALVRACADIHSQLRELAADLLGVNEDEVRVDGGSIHLPDRSLTSVSVPKTRQLSSCRESVCRVQCDSAPSSRSGPWLGASSRCFWRGCVFDL
jgi:CO/xanthine dehydrogenase Mo-binding subunit